MKNRKILYGYLIQKGEFVIQPQEAIVAKRIATLYIDGLSYQKIADTLNGEGIPFSTEAPLWNKHKVKRLLETPAILGRTDIPLLLMPTSSNTSNTRSRARPKIIRELRNDLLSL